MTENMIAVVMALLFLAVIALWLIVALLYEGNDLKERQLMSEARNRIQRRKEEQLLTRVDEKIELLAKDLREDLGIDEHHRL